MCPKLRDSLIYPVHLNCIKLTWTGLIWFEPATTTKIDAITRRKMPSGTFHYYLCAKLNADATSGTQQLHCYWENSQTFLYSKMAAARVVRLILLLGYSKNRISTINFMSKSFFQMNSISLIEWEEFWKTFIKLIFTTQKRSCGKVMFSQASVCPQGLISRFGVRAALGGFLPKGWGFSVTEKCILVIKKSKSEFQLPLMYFSMYLSWIII